jgi:hypothetical protein
MTDVEVRHYIASVEWQFAKTMAEIPHWYTVRGWRSELFEQFDGFVAFIEKYGYTKEFYGKEYKYYEIDGLKYWAMEDIINRAEI